MKATRLTLRPEGCPVETEIELRCIFGRFWSVDLLRVPSRGRTAFKVLATLAATGLATLLLLLVLHNAASRSQQTHRSSLNLQSDVAPFESVPGRFVPFHARQLVAPDKASPGEVVPVGYESQWPIQTWPHQPLLPASENLGVGHNPASRVAAAAEPQHVGYESAVNDNSASWYQPWPAQPQVPPLAVSSPADWMAQLTAVPVSPTTSGPALPVRSLTEMAPQVLLAQASPTDSAAPPLLSPPAEFRFDLNAIAPPSNAPTGARVGPPAGLFPDETRRPNEYQLPPPPGSGNSQGVQVADDGRLVFHFQNAPWRLVLDDFARRAGLSLQMLSVPQGAINFDSNTPLTPDEALDALNSHLIHADHLLLRTGRYLTVVQGSAGIPASLVPQVRIEEIDQRGRHEYFSVVFPISGTDVNRLAKELEGLKSNMGQILPLNSSNHLFVADLGENVRRFRDLVMLDGTGLRRLVHRVVPIKNAKAEEIAKALNGFLANNQATGNALEGAGLIPTSNAFQSQVAVVAETTTNNLLLRGEATAVAEIEALAREIDLAPREVIIHALLVEVELGNVDERGMEVGLQDSVLFNRSVVDSLTTLTETVSNPGTGIQTTNQRIISQTATPGFNFNNAPLGNNTSVNPGKVGVQGLGNLGVGRVNSDLGFGGLVLSASSESISVLIRALAANYNVDILSRPQIRTVDNHEAQIQIGQQVPVIDGVTLNSVGGANPVIRQDQAGIILTVTPRIGNDGSVTIDAVAEKSAFNTTPGTGVVIFADATNGRSIEAPIKNITTARTTVNVKSGQTIVLGGMITEETITNERKVPYLGDVPYLGIPFRYDMQQTQRKELLIFLSPFLIESDADEAQLTNQEVNRTKFPYESAIQMHGTPLGSPPFQSQLDGLPPLELAPGEEFSMPLPSSESGDVLPQEFPSNGGFIPGGMYDADPHPTPADPHFVTPTSGSSGSGFVPPGPMSVGSPNRRQATPRPPVGSELPSIVPGPTPSRLRSPR